MDVGDIFSTFSSSFTFFGGCEEALLFGDEAGFVFCLPELVLCSVQGRSAGSANYLH
jgi:hypothetical protein